MQKQDKEKKFKKIAKDFDAHFTTLEKTTKLKLQIDHYVKLLNQVFENVKNDLIVLDTCIKYLRKFITEGKHVYVECARAYKHTLEISKAIKEKE